MRKAGMQADVTMLSTDIASIPVEEISAVTAALTVCAGRVTLEA